MTLIEWPAKINVSTFEITTYIVVTSKIQNQKEFV